MAILDFLNKPMFSSRFKLPLHIITGVLVVIVIGLSVPRLFMKNQPRTRASTIALGMVGTTADCLNSKLLTLIRERNHSFSLHTCSLRNTFKNSRDGTAIKPMSSSAVSKSFSGAPSHSSYSKAICHAVKG